MAIVEEIYQSVIDGDMNGTTDIDALKEAGVRENVTVMIGGAPVTQNYADEIGADIYAPDGPSAARKVKEKIEV